MQHFSWAAQSFKSQRCFSLLIFSNVLAPKGNFSHACEKENVGCLLYQGKNIEIQLLVFRNLNHPQVWSSFQNHLNCVASSTNKLNHFFSDFGVFSSIFWPHHLKFHSIHYQTMHSKSVTCEIRVKWSCKRPPKAICA